VEPEAGPKIAQRPASVVVPQMHLVASTQDGFGGFVVSAISTAMYKVLASSADTTVSL
jgi:hypothetical protein